jgi:predicted esterase
MSAREEHIAVSKSARLFLLGEPASATDIWIVCHGYGQLAGKFVQNFECIASATRLIVAPEALHRYYIDPLSVPARDRRVGATWMTREDRTHDIADYVAYLDRVADHVKTRVSQPFRLHVLGFSQGSSTVFRWAAQGNTSIDTLILWAGEVPADVDMKQAEEKLAKTKVIFITGAADKMMPPHIVQLQQDRLAQAGIAFTAKQHAGAHGMNVHMLQELAAH